MPSFSPSQPTPKRFSSFTKIVTFVVGAHLFVFLLIIIGGSCAKKDKDPAHSDEGQGIAAKTNVVEEIKPVFQPRPAPAKFPRRTHLPNIRECDASGSIVFSRFSAARDLVYVDDRRVWWESEHDEEYDDEDDHSMHYAIEAPFRRLVEYVCASNATLKVQECYRATGVHHSRSLHKEGRALDLTAKGMDLETLAKLAWMSGFDWVYYECPRGGGPHIHASVRWDRDDVISPPKPQSR